MKNLDYYMSLPYEVKVQELSEDDSGRIFLSIPLLGEIAVCVHGEHTLRRGLILNWSRGTILRCGSKMGLRFQNRSVKTVIMCLRLCVNLASCNIDVDRTKNRTTQNSNYLLFIDITRAYVFYSVSPFSAER